MKRITLLPILFLFPVLSFTQGLDDRINEIFSPVADAWETLVLTSIPITASIQVPIVLLLLIGGAVFFTLYFRFVNIRRFPLAIGVVQGKYDFVEKGAEEAHPSEELITRDGDIPDTIKVEGREGEVSHFQALTAAVSGTVGLGNIAGVAVAIAMGGPGATFWMIIAGLLGMSSKFVECTLGVKYRDVENGIVYGGPMYYLTKGMNEIGFKKFGKFLAVLFAILCVGASFGGGNAFQANQAVAQVTTQFGLEADFIKTLLGVIIAVLVGIVIIGGIKRIGTVTEKVVPFMAGLYVLACLIIIVMHYELILPAFGLIIDEAFTPSAGLGGLIGVIITGFRRAAFSNEAGVGSAAVVHSAVKTKHPASEGVVSLLEPFIDTVVICTMTALVIIFFNMNGQFEYGVLDSASNVILNSSGEGIGGVDLTSLAFETEIPGFSYILTFAIFLFALSTMLSWSYYGLQAWMFLFGRTKKSDLTYKMLFLVFIIIGSAATLDAVIKFSDAMILAMVFPNMIGLLFLAPKVRTEMKKYLDAINKRFDTNL
ncbi:alanine/glycine:cation symporter family protein [Membranihabitans maritimus]|uniref:alanine/glycine:cation symporter family protein n=1 Tax=Membranihabitans maritimus TaxID=2904244 RepID=UPI001F3D13F8|nr:alanine/glycine:cation symporter family protein [Membranihabitans maritimus]